MDHKFLENNSIIIIWSLFYREYHENVLKYIIFLLLLA